MTEGEGDGRKKPPTEAEVRAALAAFADLIRRLDADERLLRNLPLIMGRLGDLRHMLFEFEVRFTERLLPSESPEERESRRIVREAIEGEREAPEDWGDPPGSWGS